MSISYHQACGRPQSGCPWMRLYENAVVLGYGCTRIRLSMDAVFLAGRGFPRRGSQWMRLSSAVFRGAVLWMRCPLARFSLARLSMEAVIQRGFPWRGCQWMRLSAGAVFRGRGFPHCTTPLVFAAVTENITFATVITHFHFSLASHFSK
jgi:hypothetical protein